MPVDKNINLYFVHGWGCDGNIWQKWLPAVGEGRVCHVFDRGYFAGAKKNIAPHKDSDTINVLIAHSLGLHLVPTELQVIDLLILTSSFRYFHEESLNGKLTSKSITLMKQRLLKDPQGLLQDFYLKCGLKNIKLPDPVNLDSQLLFDDLLFLDTHQIDLAQLQQIPQILLLHGGRDQIVNPKHSNLMHTLLPNSRLFINDQAEHALPITDAQWCMETINNAQTIGVSEIFTQSMKPLLSRYSSITNNFARAATTYDQAAQAQNIAAEKLADRISEQLASIPPGDVLEIGCGTGLLSRSLQKLFPQRMIYLLDPAEDMLAACRTNVSNTLSCQFIQSTVEEYISDSRFSKNKFALIASSFVFHWLYDFQSVLNRLLEQLSPSGRLFFSFPIAGSFPQWQNICQQLNVPFTANHLPNLDDIKLAADTDQVIVDSREYDCNIEFQNALQFFKHIKMLGANTKKFIPAANLNLKDFRALLNNWDSQPSGVLGKSNGKIICTYKILEGTVTRR